MDAARLTCALLGAAVLIGLALLTWIAVRVEQVARRPSLPSPPSPPPAEPCRRLHVAELPVEWSKLRAQRRPLPHPAEDDPPFPPR